MFDHSLRALKDIYFHPIAKALPLTITPNHVTAAAFLSGLGCLSSLSTSHSLIALCFWAGNRLLDCLDGSLARSRGTSSQLGGFLDLFGDMTVYSLIPIYGLVGLGNKAVLNADWMPIAVLDASFFVNAFVLFYSTAVLETENTKQGQIRGAKAQTAVEMPPALMEGLESGVCFTYMIMWPENIAVVSWIMAVGVFVSIVQRALWVVGVLRTIDKGNIGRSREVNVEPEIR